MCSQTELVNQNGETAPYLDVTYLVATRPTATHSVAQRGYGLVITCGNGGVRPLLLMDVDGPLNPFAAPWFLQQTPAPGYTFHELTPAGGVTYRVAVNPEHGHELQRMSGNLELAWATTWLHDANRLISPLLGLATNLPVVPLIPPRIHRGGRSWKAEQIAGWIRDRPFAWFDDEVNCTTRQWLDSQETLGRHLAHRVEPHLGLMSADFEALLSFAEGLRAP